MEVPSDDGISYYSQVAADFHASYNSDPNRLERMQVWGSFLDRYTAGVTFAYDIGCGSGMLACELAGRGIETVGIDGASGMLAIAERTSRMRGLTNLSFRQERLPMADVSGLRLAQLIVSSSAIEYLESFPAALAFLHNLLEDSGIAIFSVSNRHSLSRRLVRTCHRLTGRPRYLRFLRHFMTVTELKSATRAAGLKYLEHAYFGGADRLNRALGRVVTPPFANNMIIVAAQKVPAQQPAA
jgi:SAM-dependent methyltransferase